MNQKPGTIAKIDDEQRNIFGWAYIAVDTDGEVVIDKQGDFVDDITELEKAAYDFVRFYGETDEMHLEVPVGDVIESVVFTPEKLEKMGLAPDALPLGWWVGMHINDDEAWSGVKSGLYKMFSIGGSGFREKVDMEEEDEV